MNLLYLPINLFRSENDERFLTDILQCYSAARDCWPSLALTVNYGWVVEFRPLGRVRESWWGTVSLNVEVCFQ